MDTLHLPWAAMSACGVSLGDSGAEEFMVLFWSLSRLDAKSLERASMDYEAPLMPCGCILLPEPGGRIAHLMKVSLGHSSSMGPISPLEDWVCGSGTKDPAEEGWKRDRYGRDRGSKSTPRPFPGVISLHGQQSMRPGAGPKGSLTSQP